MNLGKSGNIVDEDDFCRSCKGKGGTSHREISDITGRFTDAWYPCHLCEGTGLRTVRVLP